jgi:hypothetical protein
MSQKATRQALEARNPDRVPTVLEGIRDFKMNLLFKRFALCFLYLFFTPAVLVAKTLDSNRIAEIAAMLQPHAAGFG